MQQGILIPHLTVRTEQAQVWRSKMLSKIWILENMAQLLNSSAPGPSFGDSKNKLWYKPSRVRIFFYLQPGKSCVICPPRLLLSWVVSSQQISPIPTSHSILTTSCSNMYQLSQSKLSWAHSFLCSSSVVHHRVYITPILACLPVSAFIHLPAISPNNCQKGFSRAEVLS